MLFGETGVRGAYVIDLERRVDDRGFFARAFCRREFEAAGLNSQLAQVNWSANSRAGTVRGLHYQLAPHRESKIVCCTRGALYDVVLDLREGSPSYRKWAAVELTAENRRLIYIPEGCGHGFQTLADDTELLYLMSEFYSPAHARGIRYNDSAFGIKWPMPVACISDADATWPDFGK
jgi:dTDP-4-dehydrorhamnose 3,5-epimerase